MIEFGSGDVIGSFTVLSPCGAGAFGQVYLVRDAEGRRFALKLLSPDRRGERELNGVLRFKRVTHPNLLFIDRLSTLPDGRVFYTMALADNAASAPGAYEPDTLARRLRERRTIPAGELKPMMLALASALAELHRAHLLHRDIKPENILFMNGRPILADAGAVGEFDGTTLIGTPGYLPPEVCSGKRAFTAADDCCALGKVLYTALTGEPPHKFPGTPRTLDTPEEIALFAVAERACTSPGVSAYQFAEFLEHPEAVRRSFLPRRRLVIAAAAVLLAAAVAAAVVFVAMPVKAPVPAPVPAPPAETPAEPVSVREKASVAYSRAFVQKLKADEAKLRAEQERMRSPTVQPVGMKRRNEDNSAEPTLAGLLKKYERTAEEQRLVDRWLAECVAFDRRINRAMWDKAKIAELTKEKKAKLPYGIADFCGDEMRMRKYLDILTRDYTPEKRQQLELALRRRRDALKTLLEKLPPSELAKWR